MQSSRNPFVGDIYDPAQGAEGEVPTLHLGSMDELGEAISEVAEPGRRARLGSLVLLLAPRAGYGKSHLLARISRDLAGRASVVPLGLNRENQPAWRTLLAEILGHFHGEAEAEGEDGATGLDRLARFTFAKAVQRLIADGRVPSATPAESTAALETHFMDLLDLRNSGHPVARWFSEYFDKLVPMMAPLAAGRAGVAESDAEDWLRRFFAYSHAAPGSAERGELVAGWSAVADDAAARGGAVPLARLASAMRPLVFAIDHLDGFFRDTDAGLSAAYLMTELQRELPGAVTILSVNEDVWNATFLAGLPSALEDRITGRTLELGGLDADGAAAILRARLAKAGVEAERTTAFLAYLNIGAVIARHATRGASPRFILRHAAEQWEAFAKGGFRAPDAPAAADEASLPPVPGIIGGGIGQDIAAAAAALAPAPRAPLADPVTVNEPLPGSATGPAAPAAAPAEGDKPKLRPLFESIGTTSTPRPAPAPQPTTEPESSPAESGETSPDSSEGEAEALPSGEGAQFDRIRAMLEKLKREREAANGNGHRAASSAAAAIGNRPARGAADPLAARFAQLRSDEWRDGNPEPLNANAISELLQIAGTNFPALVQCDFALDPRPERNWRAGKWAVESSEILFGLAPFAERPYWQALVEFARMRFAVQKKAAAALPMLPAAQRPSTKLALIADARKRPNLARWTLADSPFRTRRYLDLIALDPDEIAAVHAAARLAKEAGERKLDAAPADLVSFLAKELGFLWRRITRPIAG